MHDDDTGTALIRRELSALPSVLRTWFEWCLKTEGGLRTLVVKVRFDTDPNSPAFNSVALDDIERVF